jgi:hypothetical protein
MQELDTTIQGFRGELYKLFPKRSDAIMNLLDAVTSHGHQCRSIVQLSNASCFDRQYSSITDAIADGLPHANFKEITKLIYGYVRERNKTARHFLLLV